MNQAVIVDSLRTGLAKSYRGGFNQTRADDMTAHLINTLLEKHPQVEPDMVEDVILGCGYPEGSQGSNIARTSAVLSNLPVSVGGTTVNRFCSSGLQTVAMAATQIQSGFADCIMAGGVESISTTQPNNINMFMFENEKLKEKKPGIYHAMGDTAETVAKRYNVTRESQDEYALSSQERCAAAQNAGIYNDEIVPMKTMMKVIDKETGEESEVETIVDGDNCNRPDTNIEGLSSLKPVFDPENGTVTAGNSSGLNDGAAAMLIGTENAAIKNHLTPKSRIVGGAVAGVEPRIMGIGPVEASKKVLQRTGLSLDQMDIIELNEAFAAQSLYVIRKGGWDMDKINVNGGAIALGHPLGCSGSRIIITLMNAMEQNDVNLGLATMCIGTGQGIATILERIN